jgi:UPF0755 protein
MIRPLLITVLTLSLAAALLLAMGWREFRAFEQSSLRHDQPVRLWLQPGATLGTLARELQRLGLTEVSWRWRLLGRLHQPVLRAGEYELASGSSILQLLDQLERGEVVAHRLTIVEGWTLARLRDQLAADSRLIHVTRDIGEAELMRRLGCSECYAEGWFLPETYQFQRGDRDLDLLARAHRAMRSGWCWPRWSRPKPWLPRNGKSLPACSCAACSAACGCRPIRPWSTASRANSTVAFGGFI